MSGFRFQGRHHKTHNFIEVDFGFSDGFPSSTNGERYSITHKDLMKLRYGGRIRVVDDGMVRVADGRASVDAGELIDCADFLHGWTLEIVKTFR